MKIISYIWFIVELIKNIYTTEDFLDVTWTDGSYEDKEGILTIAVCSQKNKKFGSAVDVETLKFIICGDVLIMEKNGSYFKLERVGQVRMSDGFEG